MYQDTDKFILWEKAHKLVLEVYKITEYFPKEEIFGLTSQIRRSAISIPSNIVEGKSRGSKKDYRRFLFISRGSLEEVKYQLFLSKDLGYVKDYTYELIIEKSNEVGKMINGVINRLEVTK